MVFSAARFDGLQLLDVQQPGPLIDHLLEMPQGQPLPGPAVNENMPLLPVPHIMPQHLATLVLPIVAPDPAVVFALGLGDAQDSISCAPGKSERQ